MNYVGLGIDVVEVVEDEKKDRKWEVAARLARNEQRVVQLV